MVELPDEGAVDAPPQGARSVCGLVVQLASEDVVFVEPRDWVYRVHVGLHELAHLVCGHQGDEPSPAHLSLLPDLDPSMVRPRSAGHATASPKRWRPKQWQQSSRNV